MAVAALCLLASVPALAAGLLLPTSGEAPLDVESQKVNVSINNGVVVTDVVQVFRNKIGRDLEAIYSFPVPIEASVSNFSMWVNGKEVIGEVLEKRKAREIYDSIVLSKRDPGLLEQVSYKLFEVRVFPVPANGTQKIRISYFQPVQYDAGYAVYVYPLETKTRLHSDITNEFSLTVNLKSELPIEEINSPSHGDSLVKAKIDERHYTLGIEQQKSALTSDFVLVYKFAQEKTGIDLVTSCDGNDDGHFMVVLTPGAELKRSTDASDYCFVMDVSASMNGGKLDIAREGVKQVLEQLKPEDNFTFVTFNIAPTKRAGGRTFCQAATT